MRALCGAIISAGALIGLGLAALGFGIRFQHEPYVQGQSVGATTMCICLIVLLVATGVGIAVAFLGLMYHHERRHREWHREVGHTPAMPTT